MPYKDKETAKKKNKEYRERNKEQIRANQRNWYLRNKEKIKDYFQKWSADHKEQQREYERKYEEKLKIVVLGHYGFGEPKCVICKEARLPCLSIDHINGCGRKHREQLHNAGGKAFYRWLKQNSFPAGYQTLCMNCQFVKKFNSKKEAGCSTQSK